MFETFRNVLAGGASAQHDLERGTTIPLSRDVERWGRQAVRQDNTAVGSFLSGYSGRAAQNEIEQNGRRKSIWW